MPTWVHDAARLPVAFAQVREDPLIDAHIVGKLAPESRILMIASGGCTVAYLAAACRMASIDVVDPNPAQIALSKLKLHLLQHAQPEERSSLFGHEPMPAAERERSLHAAFREIGLSDEAIGPREVWAAMGPDFAGRYECVFAALRHELTSRFDEIEGLLALGDPREQARRVAQDRELGQALDAAFARAMALPILAHLFGEGATRNRVEPFARHFSRRTRAVLASQPAADNPYLWQVLAGRYPIGTAAPWLTAPSPPELPEIRWRVTAMTDALHATRAEFDFIQLSNILDWLSPAEARETLNLVHAALRPGGWTLIRQLNSTLDVPASGRGFDWQFEVAQALHAIDRSYFYRALHLGKKR
jgi:S-adenosylmethionine-diacylglycerol 3-amino-3-carboxypropyl transferase